MKTFNDQQRAAIATLHDTGVLETASDMVKQSLFEMFLNTTEDAVRIDLGRKADVVDEILVLFEEVLTDKNIQG